MCDCMIAHIGLTVLNWLCMMVYCFAAVEAMSIMVQLELMPSIIRNIEGVH